MIDGIWNSALIGGVAGGITVLLFALLQGRRKCPNCGQLLPRFRISRSKRQVLWGGWTCPNCNCEVDRHGNKITK